MSQEVKTICVTGASGFLGRHLSEYFLSNGWNVRALIRDTGVYPFRKTGIALFKCKLPYDFDSSAFAGADLVIHCAYATGLVSVADAFRINYLGTHRVYSSSRSHGVGQFVFISSTGAHANAESYYGRSKFALQQLFDASKDLIIQPGLIVGDDANSRFGQMVALIRKLGIVPIFHDGRQILQTIHVNDLCRIIDVAVRKRVTGILVAAEPDGVTIREFFQLVAAQLDRRCRFIRLPLATTLNLLHMLEALNIPFPLSSESLLGLKHLIHMPSAEHLARLELTVKTAEQSLALSLSKQITV